MQRSVPIALPAGSSRLGLRAAVLLNHLSADGLSGGPLTLKLSGRALRVADVERVAEAVELAAAALDRSRLPGAAARLGWAGPDTVVGGDPADPDLLGLRGPAVTRVAAADARSLTIELSLALDPGLFGLLREAALREPRIGPALADEEPLAVKVGWRFARDHTTASPQVLAVRLGDVGFDLSGKDRPPFLGELLPSIGRRLRVTDPFAAPGDVAARLRRAALSVEPAERAGLDALREVVCSPPFAWPRPEVVEVGGVAELWFGPGLASARRVGRRAVDAVHTLASAWLDRPDVLVVAGRASDEELAFWAERLAAEGAPVEQVLTG